MGRAGLGLACALATALTLLACEGTVSEPTAAPTPGDPAASPPPPYPDRDKSARELRAFLTSHEPYDPRAMPWPLERSVLGDVSRDLLASELDANTCRRLAFVARSYLLSEAVPDALRALERAATAGDVAAGAWLAALIGWLGDDASVAAAAARLPVLLQADGAAAALPDLVQARAALGPAWGLAELRGLAERRMAALNEADDYASEVEAADLDEFVENTLADLAWADEAHVAAGRAASADQALSLLMDVYLERSEYGGEEYLIPWSALEIRKQAHARGAAPVVAAFLREVEASRATREADPDAEFVALRALRGARYFGAEPGAADLRFVEERADVQRDPLSREALIPQFVPASPTTNRPRRGR